MKRVWRIAIAAGAVAGLAGPGVAQTRDDKPSVYTTAPRVPLEPNYGLPAFSLPNYERPRPKAVTPEANGRAGLDFYQATPESRYALPRQAGRAGYSTTETPLYTTQEGAPAEDRMHTDTMEPDPMESDTLGGYSRTAR